MDENNLVILGNSQILFRDVDGYEFISYTSKQSGWITQVSGKRLSSTLAKSKASVEWRNDLLLWSIFICSWHRPQLHDGHFHNHSIRFYFLQNF